jgi:hypothetical protein
MSNGNAAEDLTLDNVSVGNTGVVQIRGDEFIVDGERGQISLRNLILTDATPSGEGQVLFAFSPSVGTDGRDFRYFELERTGPTQIPATGSIIMQGHTAIAAISPDQSIGLIGEGQAELTTDFGTGPIAGRTFDIQAFGSTGDLNYLAVNFEQTTMNDGAFSGTVDPVREEYMEGTYDGLIVGPDGTEAVGSYSFEGTSSFMYYGIFTVAAP